MSRAQAAWLASVVAAATPMAYGASTSSTLTVNATVLSSCTVTPAILAFGNYSGTQVDGQTDITVLCTSGTAYTVVLDTGANSASLSPRTMAGTPSGSLNYDLYNDSGRTTIWGDGSGATGTIADTGSGLAKTHTVYGRIPASQLGAPAGAYTDTVNITVNY